MGTDHFLSLGNNNNALTANPNSAGTSYENIVGRATTVEELFELIMDIPEESILYHSKRNDFSNWLFCRSEFSLANELKNVRVDDFENCSELQKYLHDFSDGKVTGAMVLTEPDAGSDLQAIKLRAFQSDDGNWLLHGLSSALVFLVLRKLLIIGLSKRDMEQWMIIFGH